MDNEIQHLPTGVIIPHEDWKQYWEPLKQDYEELKMEMQCGDFSIRIHISGAHNYYEGKKVGIINISGGSTTSKIDKQAIEIAVSDMMYEYMSGGRYIQGLLTLDDVEKKVEEYINIRNEINAKLSRLPKLIRWLLRIKIQKL